jgi:hypothetical protein
MQTNNITITMVRIEKCKFCEKEFVYTSSRRCYCSDVCRKLASNERCKRYQKLNTVRYSNKKEIAKICECCGQVFSRFTNKRYCSAECVEWMRTLKKRWYCKKYQMTTLVNKENEEIEVCK